KMNFVSVVKRSETHRGIEKSDKLILNLTRLKISFVFQFSYSQMACTKNFHIILQAECLLTRCSVFKDQTRLFYLLPRPHQVSAAT
ncbi:hypothetical protein, partial [Paenibacillus cucumis (ex Kampfer et al. 2016)]|uniref:hypothetical protein n=1 Tax=Paenibacillus cucumis (ex Kampfer et al. 2016) TaxID=1776858 RepID=UPI001C8EF157